MAVHSGELYWTHRCRELISRMVQNRSSKKRGVACPARSTKVPKGLDVLNHSSTPPWPWHAAATTLIHLAVVKVPDFLALVSCNATTECEAACAAKRSARERHWARESRGALQSLRVLTLYDVTTRENLISSHSMISCLGQQ